MAAVLAPRTLPQLVARTDWASGVSYSRTAAAWGKTGRMAGEPEDPRAARLARNERLLAEVENLLLHVEHSIAAHERTGQPLAQVLAARAWRDRLQDIATRLRTLIADDKDSAAQQGERNVQRVIAELESLPRAPPPPAEAAGGDQG
jgi:hypothetical protein